MCSFISLPVFLQQFLIVFISFAFSSSHSSFVVPLRQPVSTWTTDTSNRNRLVSSILQDAPSDSRPRTGRLTLSFRIETVRWVQHSPGPLQTWEQDAVLWQQRSGQGSYLVRRHESQEWETEARATEETVLLCLSVMSSSRSNSRTLTWLSAGLSG